MTMWSNWQHKLEDCKVLIWYSKHHDLYPLSDWIHPGIIPVGKGEDDSSFHDLPNIEWMVRHLGWLGFRDLVISSPLTSRGIKKMVTKISTNLSIQYYDNYWYDILPILLKSWQKDIMIVYGLNISNSDLRHAILLHRQRGNKASLLSIRGLKFNVGLVKFDLMTNKIKEFQEKPVDRSLLLSSNILILDTSDHEVVSVIQETARTVMDDLRDEPSQILKQMLKKLIENHLLNTIELTGMSDEPWFLDLSNLENWIKIDVSEFISKFSHLIE